MSRIVNQFNKIVGLSVDDYMNIYSLFVKNNMTRIINFYSGVESNPDRDSFKMLNYLIELSDTFDAAVINNQLRFNKTEYWDVIDALDNIRTNLTTTSNAARWTRSTTATADSNTNPEASVVLQQFNTLERLANKSGYEDSQNSWTLVALRNDLDEDKYSYAGGNILKINILNGTGLNITDVVDQVVGDNMKGKDVAVVFKYINNDIATVVSDACVNQSYSILLSLRKGDIPEFPEMGVGVVIGGNMSTLSYPTILRQIHNTFYRDSSVKSVGIAKFNTNGDIISMNVLIESKFGQILQNSITT